MKAFLSVAWLATFCACTGNVPWTAESMMTNPNALSTSAGNSNNVVISTPFTPSDPTAVDYLAGLPTGAAQKLSLCAQESSDRFSTMYCGTKENLPSLTQVLQRLSMAGEGGELVNANFAMLGVNSGLLMRRSSAVNPTAVVYDPTPSAIVATNFARGNNSIEIVAQDPVSNTLHFYLLRYRHACDATGTCTLLDRFGPNDETNWVSTDVYNQNDLRNTPMDCMTCHAPKNVAPFLRMQEMADPWTHWMRSDRGSSALFNDFFTAHVNEGYGGIPASALVTPQVEQNGGDPLDMQINLLELNNFGGEPGVINFNGDVINGDDPNFNNPDGSWLPYYEAAIDANITVMPPYFGIDPYDDSAMALAATSYKNAVATGNPNKMVAMNNLYREDTWPFMGLIAPDSLNGNVLTPTQLVTFKCGMCHNGSPTGLSRDKFDVHDFPSNLSAQEANTVIQRLNEPESSALRMPPTCFGDLTDSEKQRIAAAMN